jgi:hypothetical protein
LNPQGTPVPDDLRGVWVRELRQTDTASPDARPRDRLPPSDSTSWVRCLQTSLWCAQLGVPDRSLLQRQALPLSALDAGQLAVLADQHGFAGVTQVEALPDGEVATWRHHVDVQPAAIHPDEGLLVFESADRYIKVGIHEDSNEVWQRLPESSSRFVALAGIDAQGQDDGRRLLVAGVYAMVVRPRQAAWPRGMRAGMCLADALLTEPERAVEWLDFEISFGRLDEGQWLIERSTLPERENQRAPLSLTRLNSNQAELSCALVPGSAQPAVWQILEWSAETDSLT